jgi:signal transduction histidine kinase
VRPSDGARVVDDLSSWPCSAIAVRAYDCGVTDRAPSQLVLLHVGQDGRVRWVSDVAISVEDTGIGIDPALLPRLFDAFSQAQQDLDRSKGGLGLGLALVKGVDPLAVG